jgi:YidC/Oxa1 family membrane protein insertase
MNIISSTLNFLINYLFNITGDFGIAIILITLLVRLILMPMAVKQKLKMQEQQNYIKGLEEIKLKYKNNKKRLDTEMQNYYKQNARGGLAFLTTLLQLPVVLSLYNVILKLPIDAGTILVPWVASLKMTDNHFIIPALYVISTLSPNILSYVPFLRLTTQAKISKANIIIVSIITIDGTFFTGSLV